MGWLEYYKERWNWKHKGGEANCEWPPRLLPGAMLKSQPELPLRAMSESVATQQQGSMSVAHITTRQHGGVTGQDSYLRDNVDVQGLGVGVGGTCPAPH